MKILNKEEVGIAKKQYSLMFSKCDTLTLSTKAIMSNAENDFVAGVEYAESKIEDLCIEFAEWMTKTNYEKSYKDYFQQFLKERSNENN